MAVIQSDDLKTMRSAYIVLLCGAPSPQAGERSAVMRANDIPVDQEGALGLCRLLLRAATPTKAADAHSMPSDGGSAVAPPPPRRLTLFERFDRWIARMRQRDRERYLAQASDVFELEARIRELERRPYY
jgi:hypothetical protein